MKRDFPCSQEPRTVLQESAQHYLYAFSILPMSSMEPAELVRQPQDVTENPFRRSGGWDRGPQHLSEAEKSQIRQYFFDLGSKPKGKKRPPEGPARNIVPGQSPLRQAPPAARRVLVLAGERRGGEAFGGEHLGHIATWPSPRGGSLQGTMCWFCRNSGEEICGVQERNYRSQHLQLQVVPVPQDCCLTEEITGGLRTPGRGAAD
uniref:Uncharacterized protein n=1 Tax=Sphaerodactylus townsendi TaxID=933632 RepID=A0ACB8G7N8_9SAUR